MMSELTGSIMLAFKLFILLGIGIYCFFAIIIVRQEQLMASVLEEQFEPILKILVFIHLAASVGVFLLALFML